MKFALVLLALLPLAYSASIDGERFVENGIPELAKQILSQFGTHETEQQCEGQLCPQVLAGHHALIANLVCASVCKEAQVLASNYLSTASPIST